MSSVEIIVGHQWQEDARFIDAMVPQRPAESTLNVLELRDIIDIVINGTNLTAPIPEEAIFGVIGNLLAAVEALVSAQKSKAIVEFHHEPWEMVLVADGRQLLISVYSIDRRRRVIARDLPIEARQFIDVLCEAAKQMLTELFQVCDHLSSDQAVRAISQSLAFLAKSRKLQWPPRPTSGEREQRVGATSFGQGLTLRYSFDAADPGLTNYRGAHLFDHHALLTPGRLAAEIHDQPVVLCDTYPVLALASLLERTRQLFQRHESGRKQPFELKRELSHLPLTVAGDGDQWTLTARHSADNTCHQWAGRPGDCLDAMVSVAELFVQDLHRANGHLKVNQRFVDLENEVGELRQWHSDLCGSNVYLDRPEDYLRRLGHIEPQSLPTAAPTRFDWPWSDVQALFPRWQWHLEIDEIDFSSLTVSDDTVYLASSEGIVAVNAATGKRRWHQGNPNEGPGSYSMAPADNCVVASDGGDALQVVDAKSGKMRHEVALESPMGPLVDAAFYEDHAFGVLASQRGLLLGLGADHQVHWRHSLAPSSLRTVLFDGPLVVAQGTDGTMVALSPEDGQVLWKIRHGGTPELGAQIHQGRLYSISHDPLHRGSILYGLYPLTGRTAWQLRLPGRTVGAPNFVDRWMVVAVERHGQTQLVGIDLEAVEPQINWSLEISSAGVNEPTPLLATTIDGRPHGLIRTDRAELTCFDIISGQIRWRSMPAEETLLLYANPPLFQIDDALVNITAGVALRDLKTGQLLHIFEAIENPDFSLLTAPFRLLFGERATADEPGDRLTLWSVDHYLALVK